ncbi:hypothetical protein DC31_02905 [Microbacterium sp. CH12i]|uniref:caspase family protein n=1 Tax=Microbacterium sp. CH12i TaxID=1479651 RepID=UPI0004618067|nr:caspase family protein [Microbacterium sp. CH12i]KDA05239.1 hypothetical protein DC31_02905 [Microbacterium sp. CH12i]
MTSRALVVGVPKTEVTGLPELEGASRDAVAIGALLRDRGYVADRTFPNGLTCDAFTTQLLELRAETMAEDQAVVYISGHGYRIPDSSGDEAGDGYDECLVLSDGLLPDDWFHDSFWPGVTEGSEWITCADTCFSATVLLAIEPFDADALIVPDPKPLHRSRRPGIARLSLAAAGEGETALELGDGPFISSWYTSQILEVLQTAPETTYRGLWTQLQQRWSAANQSGVLMLGDPWMSATDAAHALTNSPAFLARQT